MWGADRATAFRHDGNNHPYSYAYESTRTEALRLAGTVSVWETFSKQTKGKKRQDHSCSSSTMQPQKTDLQPHNPLEPCRASIVPTSDSQVVPTNNKVYQRSPVVRGETTAFSSLYISSCHPRLVLTSSVKHWNASI